MKRDKVSPIIFAFNFHFLLTPGSNFLLSAFPFLARTGTLPNPPPLMMVLTISMALTPLCTSTMAAAVSPAPTTLLFGGALMQVLGSLILSPLHNAHSLDSLLTIGHRSTSLFLPGTLLATPRTSRTTAPTVSSLAIFASLVVRSSTLMTTTSLFALIPAKRQHPFPFLYFLLEMGPRAGSHMGWRYGVERYC
jgi:hypothetical protein